MTIPSSQLLTIQKFIFLLDDFHYTEFTQHLALAHATLPLKLSETIRKKLPAFDTHEELCRKVYGGFTQKQRQSFNQLASYTFKLSARLAQNYPSYLLPNILRLQQLVNTQKGEEANFLADSLLDIAEHIDDFQTQKYVLSFLNQQSYLNKGITQGAKLNSQLEAVYENEKTRSRFLSILRDELNISIHLQLPLQKIKEHKIYFKSFYNNPTAVLRLLSRYAVLYIIYYFEPDAVPETATQKLIEEFERELNNNSYVVFPFLFDLRSNFSYLKLNSPAFEIETKEGKKEFEKFTAHYRSIKFWKNYLNIPEMFAITVKASHFLSKYHFFVHRNDYYKLVDKDDLAEINSLISNCEEFFNHKATSEEYKNDMITLKMLYGGLFILSGEKNISKGISELESMLISYQQINLSGSTDSIFICLMIGYFALKRYDKCAETFKRYLKITRNKPVYEDNDIGIHTYYYLSQLLLSGRKQYIQKLQLNYKRTLQSNIAGEAQLALKEFVSYFNLPAEIITQ